MVPSSVKSRVRHHQEVASVDRLGADREVRDAVWVHDVNPLAARSFTGTPAMPLTSGDQAPSHSTTTLARASDIVPSAPG